MEYSLFQFTIFVFALLFPIRIVLQALVIKFHF